MKFAKGNGGVWADTKWRTWYWRRTVNGKRKLTRIGTFKEFPTKAKAQRHAWQIIIPKFKGEQAAMDTFDKDQFWQALQRLYDTTLEHGKQIEKLTDALSDLVRIVRSHEDRLGRLEGDAQ